MEVKRKRRTKQELLQLEDQIIQVLNDDHPQSVRHMFYRMTDPTLPEYVPKTDKGTNNGYAVVQRLLSNMRRSGKLDFGWITDSTRRGYHVNTFKDSAEYLKHMASGYRGDMWCNAESYVEVWCESRSIAGVIQDLCKEYAVSLYPSGGFSSLTLTYESACGIYSATNQGEKDANIIYIGDYDPAGVLIDQSIGKEIRNHLDGLVNVHFHRIAITDEQIEKYNLPTKPRKAGDKRARHIKKTVEAEAMPANIMKQLLKEKIEEYLPKHLLDITKVAEESEQQYLQSMALALKNGNLSFI